MQNALALGLAAFSMQQAQLLASEDIELICTGKNMRYISVSQTQLKGEFVYVNLDSPDFPALSDTPDTLDHSQPIDCTNGTLADLPSSDSGVSHDTIDTLFVRYKALETRLQRQPYTAFAYSAALSRAPPIS
ncbi:hypothetical protein [Alteromonas sp. BMJM2]|uniref:hypothetical protein n=1 Tax=Alteromonas sp. BMJM2 TaxID=2954241 RepID=UPI0022B42955|nr:hypothetical protein [Alteromonas sp. BMJM2]